MDIQFFGRFNKSSENEHLAFHVLNACNMHKYLIYDTTFDSDGEFSNLLPHMYRFPRQEVTKGAYIYLYIHDLGDRKKIGKNRDGVNVFRFSWGLDNEVSVFNKEKDFLHIAEINETSVAFIEGDKK